MKCPHCGAEIENAKFCEYCGSQITTEMQKEQEQLNKKGCPKCGSSNIAFRRENQGEIRSKNAKKIIHKTVGYCKDCGYEWFPNELNKSDKNRKIWLWVLGWILFFPIPLTVLIVRSQKLNKTVKAVLIAALWIIILVPGFAGGKNVDVNGKKETETANSVETAVVTNENDSVPKESFFIINGESGKYGKKRKINVGTELEQEIIEYHIPLGTYSVLNKDTKSTVQISIYGNEWVKNESGWEEPARTYGNAAVITPGEEETIEVVAGSYVKISDGNEELFFTKID